MKHFFYIIFLSRPFSLLKDVLNINLVKKDLFSLVVLAIIPLFLYSQEPIGKKVTVLSPNAESYKVYGDIPVSLYTGIPQIKIPLYEIKTDYVNLDINLTYHSSGFKADNHPSWVGLGWNLNAGGVISRTVKYIPDENNSLSGRIDCANPSVGIGFYYSHNVLNKNDWYTKKDPLDIDPEFKAQNFYVDREPDIFSFNFLGYSGRFYLNHLKEWVVQCDVPLKVEFDPLDIKLDAFCNTPHFSKFTLIDDKGVRYVFGGDNAIEYVSSMLPCSFLYRDSWLAQSWYLKEIIPPIGENITYTYERGPFQSNFSCVMPEQIISGNTAHSSILSNVSATIISPVYLVSIDIPSKKITLLFSTSKSNELTYFNNTYVNLFHFQNNGSIPTGFLDFHPTSGIPYFDRNAQDKAKAEYPNYRTYNTRFIWLKLDEIKAVYNNSSEPIQKVLLHYIEQPYLRLKLDTVSIQYANSADKENYSFEYNHSLPNSLQGEPEYLSEYGDSWGYSNMKYLWQASDKSDNPKTLLLERAKLGILSKITYPTKGSTLFFFENNDYGAVVQKTQFNSTLIPVSDTYSAGLRIQRIINIYGNGKYAKKEYIYKDKNDERSSGILHAFPYYFTEYGYIFDNSGAHVTYSSVTEKNEDGTFKYTDFVTEKQNIRLGENISGCMDDAPKYVESWVGPQSYCERDFERGKILNEYYCNSTGRVYQSTHYSYINIGREEKNYIRTVDPQYMYVYYFPYTQHTGQSAYYYYCYKNKVSRIKHIVYDIKSNINYKNVFPLPPGQFVMKDETFEYDQLGQIRKETQQTSNGNIYSIETEYPYTKNKGITPYQEMTNQNMLAYPTKQSYFLGNTYLKGFKFNYSQLGSHIVLSSLEKEWADKSTVITNKYNYNSLGYLCEEMDYTGKVKSYIWDYRGRRLMVVTENATMEEIQAASQDKNIYNISLPKDSIGWRREIELIQANLPKVHLHSFGYKYSDLLAFEIKPSGETTHYIYDYNNRLQSVLDHSLKCLQSFTYKHQQSIISSGIYYNKSAVATGVKKCPDDYISKGSVNIDIPAGEIFSTISQSDADSKAMEKYLPIAKEQAENTLTCVFSKDIKLENSIYANISGSYIRYYDTNILLSYLMIQFKQSDFSTNSGMFMYGVPVAKIKTPPYPINSCYRELFENRQNKLNNDYNRWIVWIENDGTIWIKLKDPIYGRMPDSNYLMLMTTEYIEFPLI